MSEYDHEDELRINPDVDVEVIDESTEVNEEISDGFTYPCLEIQGMSILAELEYFSKKQSNSDTSLPLYIVLQGYVKQIGRFDLTLDSILDFLEIYPYTLILHSSNTNKVILDLNSGEDLEKFINL